MVKHIFWSAKEEKRIREDPTKDVKNAPETMRWTRTRSPPWPRSAYCTSTCLRSTS
ncbi:hypothetical protein ACFQ3Z_29445 [Streptomyces nogalater]